jgi:H+/gluconate symporter-like permease
LYFTLITTAAIGVLLILILVARLHAFLALFIVSLGLGLAAGMPPAKVLTSMQTGVGDALSFIALAWPAEYDGQAWMQRFEGHHTPVAGQLT